MISLVASMNMQKSARPGDARQADGAESGFSAVLAQHGRLKAEAEGKPVARKRGDGADSATAEDLAATVLPVGIALPETAAGGKELPVALPGAVPDAAGESAGNIAPAAEAAQAIAVAEQVALPCVPAADKNAEPAKAEAPLAKRAAAPGPMLAIQVAAEAQPVAPEQPSAPAQPSVALQVTPQHVAPVATRAVVTETIAEDAGPAPKPRSAASESALSRITSAESVRQPEPVIATAASEPASPAAAPANVAAQPAPQAETMQELTRIVETLAAAREAFAPAAEALSIDHAEFGELSLRFDQRRDGGLSVQLSASNPDAHRAVAEAVGAQSFHSAGDNRAGTGQPQAQAQARNAMADREGGSASRHEQQAAHEQQRRPAQQQQQAEPRRRRAGVFA